MNRIWAGLGVLLSQTILLVPVASAVPVNLTCTTDPLTTSLAIFTRGRAITFRFLHHNGLGGIPLSRANVTPADLPRLAEKAKGLQGLGTQYDLQLDTGHCLRSGNGLLDCHGTLQQSLNGHSVTYFSLDAAQTTTLSALYPGPFVQTVVNISLTLDGKDYDFSLVYDAKGCVESSGR